MKIAYIQKNFYEQDHIKSKLSDGEGIDVSFYKKLEEIPWEESQKIEIISLFFK